MSDHCTPLCPFLGCPTCRHQGDTDQPRKEDQMTTTDNTPPTAGPCPICDTHADPVREHLATHHDGTDWGPYSGRNQPDDIAIGPGRAAMYALGIWPTSTITRETLAALVRTTVPTRNQSYKVAKSLRHLEECGLIRRDGDTVTILDHTTVYARAIDSISNPHHNRFLALAAAIPTIREQIAREERADVIERREKELQLIESLMGGPYGRGLPSNGTGRRVVAAGRAG